MCPCGDTGVLALVVTLLSADTHPWPGLGWPTHCHGHCQPPHNNNRGRREDHLIWWGLGSATHTSHYQLCPYASHSIFLNTVYSLDKESCLVTLIWNVDRFVDCKIRIHLRMLFVVLLQSVTCTCEGSAESVIHVNLSLSTALEQWHTLSSIFIPLLIIIIHISVHVHLWQLWWSLKSVSSLGDSFISHYLTVSQYESWICAVSPMTMRMTEDSFPMIVSLVSSM